MGNTGQRIVTEGAIKNTLTICHNRLLFSLAITALCFVIICFRIAVLATMSDHERIEAITIPQAPKLAIQRSNIVDRNGILLSTNLTTASLFANPKKILDKEEVVAKLSAIIKDISPEHLHAALNTNKSFVWIKRNLTPQEQEEVNDLGLPGLSFKDEEKRIYPQGSLLAHVLGFVDTEGKGLTGAERYFDDVLRQDGIAHSPLQLSIDMRVQDVLHKELLSAKRKFSAIGAAGVVMDANTGEVLAMVSLPDFDPNNPSRVNNENTFNRATYGLYEMGSTFKAFAMGAALEYGTANLSKIYDASKPMRVAGFTINDFHPENRFLTVQEIFKYSSNIGMARIVDEMGKDKQRKFFTKLGLLDKVDIELGEVSAPMFPKQWSNLNSMTISYGHGIAVTPMHVAAAMAALVNGGTYLKPTLVKQAGNVEGERVMKKKTSAIMRKLLRMVVKDGTGSKAEVAGYLVGGKTGTAEKLVNGKYDNKAQLSSFVSAFPMHNPQYVVLAILDEPKGIKETFGYATGGFTAAPVVGRVISQIGPMLNVQPVDEDAPEIRRALNIEDEKGRKDIALN